MNCLRRPFLRGNSGPNEVFRTLLRHPFLLSGTRWACIQIRVCEVFLHTHFHSLVNNRMMKPDRDADYTRLSQEWERCEPNAEYSRRPVDTERLRLAICILVLVLLISLLEMRFSSLVAPPALLSNATADPHSVRLPLTLSGVWDNVQQRISKPTHLPVQYTQ